MLFFKHLYLICRLFYNTLSYSYVLHFTYVPYSCLRPTRRNKKREPGIISALLFLLFIHYSKLVERIPDILIVLFFHIFIQSLPDSILVRFYIFPYYPRDVRCRLFDGCKILRIIIVRIRVISLRKILTACIIGMIHATSGFFFTIIHTPRTGFRFLS